MEALRLKIPKKYSKKSSNKGDPENDQENKPEEDNPIKPIVRGRSNRRIVATTKYDKNITNTNPNQNFRRNILEELQASINVGVKQYNPKEAESHRDEKGDNAKEKEEDEREGDQQNEESEQKDETKELNKNENEGDSNQKDAKEEEKGYQNGVLGSTEQNENASWVEFPIKSPTPVSQYLDTLVDREIDCFERQNMLKRAVPEELGIIKLTIYRKKGGFAKMSPKYFLYDEDKNTFLLNAKRKVANKTSNYLISVEQNVFNKDSFTFIGKVRSNYKKNKYLIYDNGENIERNKKTEEEQARCELGYVAYTQGKNKTPGMRRLEFIIPNIDSDSNPVKFRPTSQAESLASKCTEEDTSSMIFFETQTPYWNEENQKYMMSFSERVKESSVKNFQLKYKKTDNFEGAADILLEFGRIDKDSFALTLKYPFSIMNAFGLALSTFDL